MFGTGEPGGHAGAIRRARVVGHFGRQVLAAVGLRRGLVVQAAAADHAGDAVRGANGVGLRVARIHAVPVQDPLRHAGVHVLHAPRIGGFGGGRQCPEGEQGAGSGAAGVFPFGFGGQSVGLAFLAGEPLTERRGVVPTHARGIWRVIGILAIPRPELAVLLDGHFGGGDAKGLADGDLVDRRFVVVALIAGAVVDHAVRPFEE